MQIAFYDVHLLIHQNTNTRFPPLKPLSFIIKALEPTLPYPLAKQGVFTSATLHDEHPDSIGCRPDYALDGQTGAGMGEEESRSVSFCTTNNAGPPWFRLDMRVSLRVITVI